MHSRNRFTIYDVMESKGTFTENPSNATSPKYRGPEPFPRMFYHPNGEERVMVPADTMVTPFGPQRLWEQREIINKIAKNAEEAEQLRAEGWHDHPTKAMRAAGKEAPVVAASADRVNELEERLRVLQEELAAARAGITANALPGKEVV